MSKLTEQARGRDCQVRYPGECLRTTDTTVCGHVRMPGITGMGLKAPDWLASHICHRCHDIADGRVHVDGWSRDYVLRTFYEGVFRTQMLLAKIGRLKV